MSTFEQIKKATMDNDRVKELTDIITEAFEELLGMADDDYITGFIVNGHLNLFTRNNRIDIWRDLENE